LITTAAHWDQTFWTKEVLLEFMRERALAYLVSVLPLGSGGSPVGARGFADQRVKDLTKVTLATKTCPLADFRNGSIVVRQHVLRLGRSEAREVLAEGLTRGGR
jgi:hypothetical protein